MTRQTLSESDTDQHHGADRSVSPSIRPSRWETILQRLPIIGSAMLGTYARCFRPRSGEYWQRRYRSGGTSGSGSIGRLARFKADTINRFVASEEIASIVEFGCGDGQQLELAEYPDYLGVDVSPDAIERCRRMFAGRKDRRFAVYSPETLHNDYEPPVAEAALSLDVIYHLLEEAVFDTYMRNLFASAHRFVVIYSSDFDAPYAAPHVRHWKYSDWVKSHVPEWSLRKKITNPYPFVPGDPNTSWSDFAFFVREA